MRGAKSSEKVHIGGHPTAQLSLPYFSTDTKSLVPSAPANISFTFQIFYIMKMFEQTNESELEDSLGEYETAAERYSRDRPADAVRDVICDITQMK